MFVCYCRDIVYNDVDLISVEFMKKDCQTVGIKLLTNEWFTIQHLARLQGTNSHHLTVGIIRQFLKDNQPNTLPDEV